MRIVYELVSHAVVGVTGEPYVPRVDVATPPPYTGAAVEIHIVGNANDKAHDEENIFIEGDWDVVKSVFRSLLDQMEEIEPTLKRDYDEDVAANWQKARAQYLEGQATRPTDGR